MVAPRRFQAVSATVIVWFSLSAGVRQSRVIRGRVLRRCCIWVMSVSLGTRARIGNPTEGGRWGREAPLRLAGVVRVVELMSRVV